MRHEPAEVAAEFERFFEDNEPALRRALIAGFGPELGRDAAAEAFAYGWREWRRVSVMANPAGYLYRVGERWARRDRRDRRPAGGATATVAELRQVEPGLDRALESLTIRQRQAVVLVEGFGFTHAEAAELLGLKRTSIQNHVERAMSKLRQLLGVLP